MKNNVKYSIPIVGSKVSKARHKLGISQNELSNEIGVCRSYISGIECGSIKYVKSIIVNRLCNSLHIDYEDIIDSSADINNMNEIFWEASLDDKLNQRLHRDFTEPAPDPDIIIIKGLSKESKRAIFKFIDYISLLSGKDIIKIEKILNILLRK